MEYTKFGESWVIRLARGEEIVSSVLAFCKESGVKLGSLTGIGAAEQIELGYYDVPKREYVSTILEEQHEITGLVGNISQMEGKPYVHLHATLGDRQFQAKAGHLARATVSATCEIIVHEVPGDVDRFKDEDVTGLNLWKL